MYHEEENQEGTNGEKVEEGEETKRCKMAKKGQKGRNYEEIVSTVYYPYCLLHYISIKVCDSHPRLPSSRLNVLAKKLTPLP